MHSPSLPASVLVVDDERDLRGDEPADAPPAHPNGRVTTVRERLLRRGQPRFLSAQTDPLSRPCASGRRRTSTVARLVAYWSLTDRG
jgi:hypothetical protein